VHEDFWNLDDNEYPVCWKLVPANVTRKDPVEEIFKIKFEVMFIFAEV
jgi:hypothetical protein